MCHRRRSVRRSPARISPVTPTTPPLPPLGYKSSSRQIRGEVRYVRTPNWQAAAAAAAAGGGPFVFRLSDRANHAKPRLHARPAQSFADDLVDWQ